MISGIHARVMPQWPSELRNCDALPITDVLRDSLYYPSCGRDGDPVRYLVGQIIQILSTTGKPTVEKDVNGYAVNLVFGSGAPVVHGK
jgi:hypothetical protein